MDHFFEPLVLCESVKTVIGNALVDTGSQVSLITEPRLIEVSDIIPYPTALPYGNGTVLHFYQQQESRTTKTVHKVINRGLKTYV